MLQNLVGNARSFSPAGGTVTLGLRREGAAIVVDVEDNGPGVPPGMEEAIFRRFYTLRPEGEAFGAHSGLGLSISRQIVDAHGGRLTCANRLDRAGRPVRRPLPSGASRRSVPPSVRSGLSALPSVRIVPFSVR